MRIAEFFQSIQGEGEFAGTPSVFVRTTGCNLRCWFCDTPYTSWQPEGAHEPWPALAERILACDCQHVVITGGEPLLQPDIVPLTERLTRAGRLVTIETAGTVHRPAQAALMSISPKRPNSTPRHPVWSKRHETLRDRTDVVARMTREYRYQLKYVIDSPADVADVDGHVARIGGVTPDRVFLMPQGIDVSALREKTRWLNDEAARRGYRVSPRLHIELFGNRRAT
ncbi:MAG TPA: 7-carboxy-7-deazaguanine synthase QueE [Planctomycetaceae bacterium]|nr:7-carboxy-7-deazaguanine synthase QueE [Planctomycetaceae bacterium]